MSHETFARLMFVLLLLTCAALVLRDLQIERVVVDNRREVDRLHARLNRLGLIDRIDPEPDVAAVLAADSDDQLATIAEGQTR